MFSLDGQTALVTGARTGIGAAIAAGLEGAGATVIRHGHRDEDFVLDLASPSSIGDVPDADILVNNAGIIHRGPVLETPLEPWREVMAVNLDSVYALCRAVGAGMVARGHGKIINIASMLSFQGGINVAGYTASKHAVVGLTKALANEWAPHNVQVNAIAPGYIATNNTAALQADPVREPQIRARIPAGRWGTPADLVGAAVFLAAPASDYVTGHVLAVDGGWLSR